MIKKLLILIAICGVLHAAETRVRRERKQMVQPYKKINLDFSEQSAGESESMQQEIIALRSQILQEYQATVLAQNQLEELNKDQEAEDDRFDILKSRLAYFDLLKKSLVALYKRQAERRNENFAEVIQRDLAAVRQKGVPLSDTFKGYLTKEFMAGENMAS